jgi:hypothetical protein
VAGKKRKPDQQAEEVGKKHPFVTKVANKASQPHPGSEGGKEDLVAGNGDQTTQRDGQHIVVKERHAQKGSGKQEKLKGDAQKFHFVSLPGIVGYLFD